MSAYRIFSRLNTFYGLTGQLLAGGYIRFYTEETTTPKDVYGDEALSVNNGSTVDLDASGRPDVDVWGDGDYFIELYDAGDVLQGDMDNVAIYGGGGLTIPALVSGQFLSNNGTVLDWEAIRQVPDPTGQTGKVLGNDGTNPAWQAAPTAPTLDVLIDDSPITIRVGDGADATKGLIQASTDTAPANPGGFTTTKAVVFPIAYSATPVVTASTASIGSQPGGPVCVEVGSVSATGFTVSCDVAEGDAADASIINPVPFQWIAVGTKEVA